MSSQFGAICDQTEFNTNVHTLSLTADMNVTEKLNVFAGALFNDATVDWQELSLTTPAIVTDPVVTNIYTFEGANVMQNYSDLHYQQVELNLGGTYQFTPALYVAANVGWQMFEDKQPYVYGDQDGTAYRGTLGVGYKF